MPSLMRYINIVSRCGAIYRSDRLRDTDLGETHYSYILCVCRNPGISQDQLARRLFINKSNVTRNLVYLESHGYITRTQSETDRRVTLVSPTPRALEALPMIRSMIHDWRDYITDGFTEEELDMFASMMARIAEKAAKYAQLSEEAFGDIESENAAPAGGGRPDAPADAGDAPGDKGGK